MLPHLVQIAFLEDYEELVYEAWSKITHFTAKYLA